MRRILTSVLALWLVSAGMLALAPAASAADTVFAGTWRSIDTDGSTQGLAIGRGSTPAVTYQDFYASSCDTGGAPSTHFVATGRGTIDGSSLWVSSATEAAAEPRSGHSGWRSATTAAMTP